jgi:GTP-binding protein EngB required for normal cell division
LQTDVLPIGVTPVTAIPTRISHGPVAEAGIEFAEAQPRIISLFELPEFATEQKNPGNKKHVTRIFVKLPSDRLAEGVTFVDTPGLGSLAVAGAEETIAYLPRCDLGIVLIDASAGLTQDDLVVVQALYQAGASAMILISKADLFRVADRQQMISYVRRIFSINFASTHRCTPLASSVRMRRCVIAGLKANCARFSPNIKNWP